MPVTLNAAVTLQTEKSRYQPTADEQNTKRSNPKEKKKIKNFPQLSFQSSYLQLAGAPFTWLNLIATEQKSCYCFRQRQMWLWLEERKKKSLPENHKDLWDYRIGTPIQLIDHGKLNTVPPKQSVLLLCGAVGCSSLEQGQFQGHLITAPSVRTEVRRWSQSLHSCAWWEGQGQWA